MTRAPTKASMETGPKCLSRRADADWRLVRFGCANEDLIRKGSDVTCWVANGRFDDPPTPVVVDEVDEWGPGPQGITPT